MFCPNCGGSVLDGSSTCPYCGGSIFQTPVIQYPMKWYKFLIYFALFAGAIGNGFSSISYLTGSIWRSYQVTGASLYDVLPAMKVFDMLYGVVLIGLAAWSIVTRSHLAKKRINGPFYLLVLYAANAVFSLVYTLAAAANLTGYTGKNMFGSMIGKIIPSLAVSVAMVVVNYLYFDKRRSLFTNP